MKKSLIFCLIAVSLAFATFVAGFYIGKNWARPDVQIQVSNVSTSGSNPSADPTPDSSDSLCVNINTATKEELMTLPGIGEVLADRIIEYRTLHGAFQNVTDLAAVEGIGQVKLANILPYITIGG